MTRHDAVSSDRFVNRIMVIWKLFHFQEPHPDSFQFGMINGIEKRRYVRSHYVTTWIFPNEIESLLCEAYIVFAGCAKCSHYVPEVIFFQPFFIAILKQGFVIRKNVSVFMRGILYPTFLAAFYEGHCVVGCLLNTRSSDVVSEEGIECVGSYLDRVRNIFFRILRAEREIEVDIPSSAVPR